MSSATVGPQPPLPTGGATSRSTGASGTLRSDAPGTRDLQHREPVGEVAERDSIVLRYLQEPARNITTLLWEKLIWFMNWFKGPVWWYYKADCYSMSTSRTSNQFKIRFTITDLSFYSFKFNWIATPCIVTKEAYK